MTLALRILATCLPLHVPMFQRKFLPSLRRGKTWCGMNELFAALFSWAVVLSGYPAPAVVPDVEFVSHRQLSEMACGGTECKVIGFHPPGSNRVYIDNRLHPEKSTFAASIVVHEFVHFLQQSEGKYALHYSCSDALAMEREAYYVQSRFLEAHGIYHVVGNVMYHSSCGQ